MAASHCLVVGVDEIERRFAAQDPDHLLGGAALDVFDVQPLPPGDALFDCPNLLLTPHTAGITATSSRAMAVGSAEEMLKILRGEAPLNLVNPAYKSA